MVSGLLIPFWGTVLGSACVFLLSGSLSARLEKLLMGFAAGVMVAASIWSLLIPSLNQAESLGKLSFIPAAVGFWAGILFLLFIDTITPHLHGGASEPEGPSTALQKTSLMLLAVTIHNIPEGMASGVVIAAALNTNSNITAAAALALSIGIAIQNFPEGAIISMPLHAEGMKKPKAFLLGVLSGAVEPAAGFITVLIAEHVLFIMPYLLAFAAGSMIYVVIEELVPDMSRGKHSNAATIAFAAGFTVMMVLDVALG